MRLLRYVLLEAELEGAIAILPEAVVEPPPLAGATGGGVAGGVVGNLGTVWDLDFYVLHLHCFSGVVVVRPIDVEVALQAGVPAAAAHVDSSGLRKLVGQQACFGSPDRSSIAPRTPHVLATLHPLASPPSRLLAQPLLHRCVCEAHKLLAHLSSRALCLACSASSREGRAPLGVPSRRCASCSQLSLRAPQRVPRPATAAARELQALNRLQMRPRVDSPLHSLSSLSLVERSRS